MKTFIISIIIVEQFVTVELKFDTLYIIKGEKWKPESENKFPVRIVLKAFTAMLKLVLLQHLRRLKNFFNRQSSIYNLQSTALVLTARATVLKSWKAFSKPDCALNANTKKQPG